MKTWKSLAALATTAIVCGCGFLPASVRQAMPASAESFAQAIPPGAGINGRAGRLQDSLRTRLEWLASRLAKDGPLVERLAFAGSGEDSIRIDLQLTDANGWNTHGRSGVEVACLEAERWTRRGKDWPKLLKEAGLASWPLSGTLAFRGHDIQRGRSDWSWDTLGTTVSDSLRWTYRGAPLPCSGRH